jgi:hypothetical protein
MPQIMQISRLETSCLMQRCQTKNAMSVQQIQAFLDSKNKCNNTNTYLAAQYPQVSYSIKNGKFVCMAQESFNGQSAAQLIWQASQDYSINPQVLIVLLEKEQGLISDTWPNSRQYKTATGMAAPTRQHVTPSILDSTIKSEDLPAYLEVY